MIKSKIDLYVIQKVKDKRLENNFSQADVAYELNMSVGFIGKVESPKYSSHYNIKHLNDLARFSNAAHRISCPKNLYSSTIAI